jgi:hypothetical protein
MEQHSLSGPDDAANEARIDLIIHPASQRDVRSTLDALGVLDSVRSIGSTIRVLVEGDR